VLVGMQGEMYNLNVKRRCESFDAVCSDPWDVSSVRHSLVVSQEAGACGTLRFYKRSSRDRSWVE
jgi:hypothetical protein